MSVHFARLLTAALAGCVFGAASPAASQQIPVIQSGADGRFETQIDGRTQVPGFEPDQVAALRGTIGDLTAMLSAIPQVHAPTAPVCRRVRSSIEIAPPPRGVLTAEVGVMTPISYRDGRCSSITGGGIVLWLNRADDVIVEGSHALVRGAEDGAHDWIAPRFETMTPERLVLDNGLTVLTRPDRPLYRPVSLERYMREMARRSGETGNPGGHLARFRTEELPALKADSAEVLESMRAWASSDQIAETKRMHEESWRIAEAAYARMDAGAEGEQGRVSRLDALSAAERAAQTCISDSTGEPSLEAGCPNGVRLWELNPDYFDTTRPGEVQLIVMAAPPGPYSGETAVQHATRLEIMRDMDLSAFRPR